MKKKNKIILIITGIIIVISLCIGFTKKEFQNDTFYTIKVGEAIVKNGVDMIDHFSWHDLSYTYPHWLYDLIIYKIYDLYDFVGIYVSTMVLYSILGLLVFYVNLRRTKSTFLSLVMTIITTIICGVYATARAQLVTYILFVLELYFIERLLNSSKKRYSIILLILCILIANIHSAVWPFYFVLFLPYIAENIICKLKNKFIKSDKASKVFEDKLKIEYASGFKLLLITMIISLFAGLVTPIKDMPYMYAVKIMMGNTQDYIFEHAPLALVENPFVLVFIVVFLFILIFTKVKVKLSDFFMISGILLMSFMSVRHVSFLLTIGMIVLAGIVTDAFSFRKKQVFDLEFPWIGSLVVMIVVILCSKFIYDNTSNKDYVNKDIYPIYAMDYLEGNYDMEKIKLYNDYDFGSYILFRDVPVYIDSRSDLYTEPFNKEFDIFDECMEISDNYGAVFNKYKITHVLTYSSTELSKILTVSDNYKEVYFDGAFKIFEVKANYDPSKQISENN